MNTWPPLWDIDHGLCGEWCKSEKGVIAASAQRREVIVAYCY